MYINLKRRYPDSRPEDITDAFDRGFRAGYDQGYKIGQFDTEKEWDAECRMLRDTLRAILIRGEAPEHATNDSDCG